MNQVYSLTVSFSVRRVSADVFVRTVRGDNGERGVVGLWNGSIEGTAIIGVGIEDVREGCEEGREGCGYFNRSASVVIHLYHEITAHTPTLLHKNRSCLNR